MSSELIFPDKQGLTVYDLKQYDIHKVPQVVYQALFDVAAANGVYVRIQRKPGHLLEEGHKQVDL